MENIDKAIEAAYQSELANLYKIFFDSMVMAEEDERLIDEAKDRFKMGLVRAASIHHTARSLADPSIL